MGVVCEVESGYLNNGVSEIMHRQIDSISRRISGPLTLTHSTIYGSFKDKIMIIQQYTVLLAQGPGKCGFNVLFYAVVVGIPILRVHP